MRLFFLIAFNVLILSLEATNIVIIGGGPAGLATAIEAHLSGADVLIVEKRDSHKRNQLLFLFDYSLKLLEKWDVCIPLMQIAKLEDDTLMGVTKIKDLEGALERRAHALGIQIIQAKFLDIEESSAVIFEEGIQKKIPYDVLVGADGSHSSVRNTIGISFNTFGKATSIAAVMMQPHPEKGAEFLNATLHEGLFTKRIFFPGGRVFILQYPLDNASSPHPLLDQQKLISAAERNNYFEESDWISTEKSFVTPEIPILLQQAVSFSDIKRSVILVGDSAATAPFCQAMGANTALKTAEIAGEFFATFMKNKNQSYFQFNEKIKEATDDLISNSLYLVGSDDGSKEDQI